MTSSKKHLGPHQDKWDYSVQRYKDLPDVFCEEDLVSVLFLACNRPDVTKRSLLSTVDALRFHEGEIEWIFMENGGCDENFALFKELSLSRKVIIRQENYGINEAFNQMWALSRGEFCMVHENDFECRLSVDFLAIAKDIMKHSTDIGVVQLRSIDDPRENWGRGKPEFSPWSCNPGQLAGSPVKLWQEHTANGHPFAMSDLPYGWNNNPNLIRKSLYRECGPLDEAELGCDPRHGETAMQVRVGKSGAMTAHICMPLYFHIGQQSTKRI
jgi:GT2 family glycosyltransferase